jgi:hypothetical protein
MYKCTNINTMLSRYNRRNVLPWLWRLQEVLGWIFWQLSCFCPSPHVVEIPASMLRVKVYEGFGCRRIPPHLSEHADVHRAHQLLPKDVQAVCYVQSVMI